MISFIHLFFLNFTKTIFSKIRSKMRHQFLFTLLSVLFFQFNTQGQNSSILENLEWRNIGPDRGGRSLAVSGSSSRINEYYFGAVGGGLWKTTDGV